MNLTLDKKNKQQKEFDQKKDNNKKDKDIIVEHKDTIETEAKKKKSNDLNDLNDIKEEKKLPLIEKIKDFFNFSESGMEMPRIIKTNLIKGDSVYYFDWKGNILNLVKNIAIAFFLVGAVHIALLAWEIDTNKKGINIKEEVDELQKKVSRKEKNISDINLFQKKVAVANSLLTEHIYWTNFFDFLENYLLEDVYIVGAFNGGTSGVYNFSAKAKNYEVLSAQLVILRELEIVNSIEILGGSLSGDKESLVSEIDFNFTIKFKKDIFYK